MPIVKIEIRDGKTEEYKKALLDGIHNALVEAIKIPDWDRFQRLYELDAANFEKPDKYSDDVVIIEITLFKGRSFEAKKMLYQLIVDKLADNPGIAKEDVLIVLHEVASENWGVHGGKPASEIDIGFNVNV